MQGVLILVEVKGEGSHGNKDLKRHFLGFLPNLGLWRWGGGEIIRRRLGGYLANGSYLANVNIAFFFQFAECFLPASYDEIRQRESRSPHRLRNNETSGETPASA